MYQRTNECSAWHHAGKKESCHFCVAVNRQLASPRVLQVHIHKHLCSAVLLSSVQFSAALSMQNQCPNASKCGTASVFGKLLFIFNTNLVFALTFSNRQHFFSFFAVSSLLLHKHRLAVLTLSLEPLRIFSFSSP